MPAAAGKEPCGWAVTVQRFGLVAFLRGVTSSGVRGRGA